MWKPRMAALAILVASLIGYALTYHMSSSLPLHPNFWEMITSTFSFACGLIAIASVGCVIASYGYELDANGCLQPRPNLLGSCISRIVPDDVKRFCGIGAITGYALAGLIPCVSR
ncbi:MAG: hypothetical protein Q8R25_03200 [bacterium]|nr:hypothetical protein [bacterium]